jgi:hypothetical protein
MRRTGTEIVCPSGVCIPLTKRVSRNSQSSLYTSRAANDALNHRGRLWRVAPARLCWRRGVSGDDPREAVKDARSPACCTLGAKSWTYASYRLAWPRADASRLRVRRMASHSGFHHGLTPAALNRYSAS